MNDRALPPSWPATQPPPSLEAWLEAHKLLRLAPLLREHDIAEDVLTSLEEADLEKLGISMGDRKRLMKAIATLNPPPIEAGSVAATTEHRQLTIMFCDLVDATALCTRLTPEQWRQVVLAYQQAAMSIVTRCGGVVAQYLGDGLLVYFGYPQALEDAAVRAVHAGLELVRSIRALDVDVGGAEPVQLHVRIGIDTGAVVIGDVGVGARREQLALGDAPNIAARLQALAGPDTVFISDATRRLTAGSFVYQSEGVPMLKGVGDALQVWRVTAHGTTPSRFDAHAGAALSPLVGRLQELSLLMDRWEAARRGQGQVVMLSGEPGIGKSRMLKELCDRLGESGLNAMRMQCVAHRSHSAFHPMADALARTLRFKPDMPAATKLDRIEAFVHARHGLPLRHAALLASMLGVTPDGRHALPATSALQREQDVAEALADLLAARAMHEPLLLQVEDVHWADPASLVALARIVERIKALPVLLVVTHRPEFIATFGQQGHVTVLKVPALTRAEVAAMVAGLTRGHALAEGLTRQIESRTDGVPLFVEELTKALIERPCAQGLPVTLRDSLMARLDRHPGAKEVAQIGSAIGREFSHELLMALYPQRACELADGIEALLEAGLAMRQDSEQGAIYVFKHALVQDAAYDSMLSTRKAALHEAIVKTLQARHPRTVQDQPAVLARHAMLAGLAHEAIAWWRRASEQALSRLALHEATAHVEAALQVAGTLAEAPCRDQIELELQASLGTIHMVGKGWAAPQVQRAYARASALAMSADKVEHAVWPLWGICVYHLVGGEITQAQAIGRRLVTVARQSNSRHAWLVTNMLHTQLHFYSGDLARVHEACEQVDHGYNDPQDRSLIPLYSTDLKLVSIVHGLHAQWILGKVQDVDAAYAAIERRAAELDHPYSMAWTWTWAALIYLHAGQPEGLRPKLERGLKLADQHGFAYVSGMARFALGWCDTQQGQLEQGIARMAEGLTAFHATGAGIVRPFFMTLLAEALGRAERHREGLQMLDDAQALIDRFGERWHEAELHRVRAALCRAMPGGDSSQASQALHRAMASAVRTGATMWAQRVQEAMRQQG